MDNLTTYQRIGNPKVQSIITIGQWYELIKNNPDKDLVAIARRYKTEWMANPNDKFLEEKYKNFKAFNFITICFNSIVNGYRSLTNYASSTGLMYIDVDKDGFNVNILDRNKVLTYYKSVGGMGYAIIVRVDDLTLDNYESTFNFIINDLGLNEFYDSNAKGMIQQSIVSYDPNIYINKNPFVYKSINNDEKSTLSNVNRKNEKTYTREGGLFLEKGDKRIRYDNTNEIEINGSSYIVNWDGYRIIKAWMPMTKIREGSRYNYFLAYATNLLWLNPFLNYNQLMGKLKNTNQVVCINLIAESQLLKIAKTVLKQLKEGKLYPIEFNKLRKIVFAHDCAFDGETKKAIVRGEIAKYKTDKSKEKLYQIIETWDFELFGKITQSGIVKSNKISRKTVQKYWTEFRKYVFELNRNYKNGNVKSLEKKKYIKMNEACKPVLSKDKENVSSSAKQVKISLNNLCFEKVS